MHIWYGGKAHCSCLCPKVQYSPKGLQGPSTIKLQEGDKIGVYQSCIIIKLLMAIAQQLASPPTRLKNIALNTHVYIYIYIYIMYKHTIVQLVWPDSPLHRAFMIIVCSIRLRQLIMFTILCINLFRISWNFSALCSKLFSRSLSKQFRSSLYWSNNNTTTSLIMC